ncbi:peptide-N(4)-(N-acetyl-beta-glucosaminyl)asparagine amidase [Brenneria izadpanahii]|uniref:Peptide-N(4)-(N-acetyl-beta-glucosaminyl)asparagine amidase n=1 Tax=Brenneria izadpanahii TaxID=2722756 RepID=A0ABX7UUQ6_9GAMM|nr:peptide-N4-asparagine amidase [Brenneria izadpanahii]QTF09120.1 peptide-N(4)-(N-acetyl-beta-glucosaminyl)asparagine amidase [Brenneria izadpanahii]
MLKFSFSRMLKNARFSQSARRLCTLPLAVMLSAQACLAAPPGTPIVPAPAPEIGSRQVAGVDLLVARPHIRACTVELFPEHEFNSEAPLPVSYRPPGDCPGPWSKVVLEMDFHVSSGQQYDRSARLMLGSVNIYTGTTAEPTKTHAPKWHVERDLTDYSSFLRQSVLGEAQLTNAINETLNGRIWWTAQMVFYPVDSANPAPDSADLILPLSNAPVLLNAAAPTLTGRVDLPRNATRVMLDVLAMPQQRDEFWYMCMPMRDTVAEITASDKTCGFPFRQTEVRIDGTLAGIAPVFPWIYTGGFYPALWKQIPGIETLNLSPYRVDLTPFAGKLNDGKPHHIDLTAVGFRGFAVMTGTLLIWRDPDSDVVQGELTSHSGEPVAVTIARTIPLDKKGSGEAVTTAKQTLKLTGYVDTSRGRVTTQTSQTMSFDNTFTRTPYSNKIVQMTSLTSQVIEDGPSGRQRRDSAEHFPLTVRQTRSDVAAGQKYGYDVQQELARDVATAKDATRRTRFSVSANAVVIVPGKSAAQTLPPSSTSQARLQIQDSLAGCYDRTIASRDATITSVTDGCRVSEQSKSW